MNKPRNNNPQRNLTLSDSWRAEATIYIDEAMRNLQFWKRDTDRKGTLFLQDARKQIDDAIRIVAWANHKGGLTLEHFEEVE